MMILAYLPPFFVLFVSAVLATIAAHLSRWNSQCSGVAVSGVAFAAVAAPYLLITFLVFVPQATQSSDADASVKSAWAGVIAANIFAVIVAIVTGVVALITYAAADRAIDGSAGIVRGRDGCCPTRSLSESSEE
jgi:orotate phosphoribosyltransferase-like protein